MKRDNLRKVEVYADNEIEYSGYFHEIYKQDYWNGESRATAIIELESGELKIESIFNIKFIS